MATFVELGYAGASMEAIARAAGITKRSLYARYPDKRAVFAEVIPWALARYTDDSVVEDVDEEDVEAALIALGARRWRVRRIHRTFGSSELLSTRPRSFPEFNMSAESMMWAGRQRVVTKVLRRLSRSWRHQGR